MRLYDTLMPKITHTTFQMTPNYSGVSNLGYK
jgi:hypothetical protein